jgi:5-methylcytosine-specific restriction endonuclease McrA
MSEKKCGKCKAIKSPDQFSKNSTSKDGLQGNCKSCCTQVTKEYALRNKARSIEPSNSHKVCRVCKLTKQSIEFSRHASNKDGLQTACKACTSAYLSEYHTKNRERQNIRSAENYARNKAARNAANKLWLELNKERATELAREYYRQNRDRILERSNKRYEEKGEEIRARLTAYRAAYPERRRAIDARMRVKRLSAPGSHTAADISNLMKLQRGKCVVCKCNIRKSYHVDHIQPLAKGGSNDRDNLQLLCPPCNKRKHARDPIEFMKKQGFLL